jgi:hypothetical protein
MPQIPAERQGAVVNRWIQRVPASDPPGEDNGSRRRPRAGWFAPLILQTYPADRASLDSCVPTVSRDISSDGVGVFAQRRLPLRTRVLVSRRGESAGVTGRVAHCTPNNQGWYLGIAFDPPDQVAAPVPCAFAATTTGHHDWE